MYGFNGKKHFTSTSVFSWPRSSSSNIDQNFKGTNFSFEKASDLSDNIFGRHVTRLVSQPLEELLISRDTMIFLLTHLGFVINSKKSILVPV